MHEKLLKTITNLGSPKVLVVGDFMLDSYIFGDALRISPEAPVPVLKVKSTEYGCGGAGAVVNDLAALGAKPICVGTIGNDSNGQKLEKALSQIGADISGLVTIVGRPTISKQRLIGLAQHRHRQQLMRIDEESTDPLAEKQYQQVLEIYQQKLQQADLICLQDHNKGLLCESFCKELIKLASKAGKKVIVDPAITSDYSKYKNATLITPNRKEASAAVGFEIETTDDAARAANQLRKKYKLEAVVITLDKEGAYLRTAKKDKVIPTRPRSVYDVTGAGDMVLSTIAAVLAAGANFETAVQLANIAGGIQVEKFGAVTVSIEEIVNEIMRQNRGSNGKLRNRDALVDELNWHRQQKQTIVFTNGCFDIVHRGHIEYLNFCKQKGDVVVLGLNSDSSVKAIKGPDRPINNQFDRAAVLTALESIDYITIFDELDPLKLIEIVKPDFLVKGKDWAGKGVVGAELVKSYGGKVVLAPLVKGKSSTATIKMMKKLKER